MDNPNFYAIIPASVRYDSNLKPNAKLLYGEITALCNQEGYCWASNDYFSKLYNVSKETISRWISQLNKNNHINVVIENQDSTNKKRRIYIQTMTEKSKGIDEKVKGYCQKGQGGIDEKVKYNNTVNTTTNNTHVDFFEKVWKMYPEKKGKGQISETQKVKIYKYGDEFIRCIERYKKEKEVDKWRKWQNGSTFFNSGYIDYLDANYNLKEEKKVISLPIL